MNVVRHRRPDILRQIPIDRSTVIEASAGTGKTWTLEHLVVELIVRGEASLDRVLVVTFTEKATREMRERVRAKLAFMLRAGPGDEGVDPPPEDDADPWEVNDDVRARLRDAVTRFDRAPISTIHGFCHRVLSEHAFDSSGLFEQEQIDPRKAFGRALRAELRRVLAGGDPLGPSLERVLADKSEAQLEDALFRWWVERGRPMPPLSELADDGGFETAFARLVHGLVPRVRDELDAFKRRRGQLDFDDMLLRVRDALHGSGGAALRRELRGQYRYALVDEFQDTDEVQWDIFRTLFFQAERNVLFVIGDPKQAIYGFRGADVHTYLRARDEIAAGGGASVRLTHCFRATPGVIDGYNRIVGGDYFEGGIDYVPVEPGRPELRAVDAEGRALPSVVLWQLAAREAWNAGAVRPALYERIAREIRALVDGSDLRFGAQGAESPLACSDVHVLTRSRREAFEVAEALARHGVPHALYRQEGLFQRPEAEHLRDVLRAVEAPDDRSRRLRAWLTPLFGLRLEDLAACRDVPDDHPLVARLHRWKALAEAHDWGGLARSLVEDSGLARRELFFADSERELTNYLHLLEFLIEQAHARRRGLPELVADLDAYVAGRALPPGMSGNVQRLETEREAVQILTMHSAKGLEAKVVFVAGGLFRGGGGSKLEPRVYHQEGRRFAWIGKPTKEVDAQVKQELGEEDQRLFYVALTRAAGRLYLPYVGKPPPGYDGEELQWEGKRSKVSGAYRVVNDRLRALVADGVLGEAHSPFGWELIVAEDSEPARVFATPGAGASPGPRPDETIAARGGELERLRRERAGFVVTSYTRLEAGRRALSASIEAPGEEFFGEATDAPVLEEEALAGGAAMGVFLHEVLEELPFELARDAPDAETFGADETVTTLFRAAARRNGIASAQVPLAQRLLFDALRAPVAAEGFSLPEGFASVERRVAEMRFHFPVPEPGHPLLDAARPPPDAERGWPFEVDRGFVRGVVDLVFEHDGRIYFLDWKSDRLPGWDAAALGAHIDERYALQARLYALGIVRMLDTRDNRDYDARFGGLLYCFLRGMARGEGGVVFERPSFEQVCRWERALRDSSAPWGYPLGR